MNEVAGAFHPDNFSQSEGQVIRNPDDDTYGCYSWQTHADYYDYLILGDLVGLGSEERHAVSRHMSQGNVDMDKQVRFGDAGGKGKASLNQGLDPKGMSDCTKHLISVFWASAH